MRVLFNRFLRLILRQRAPDRDSSNVADKGIKIMASDADRVAQVFIWKQGPAPDFEYALHVLNVVNPETARTLASDRSRLQVFTVTGPWPDEPWERAITDMRSVPTPDGSQWTDTSRYDLTGWQGTDSTTGERLFTVTAYRRAAPSATFTGASISAPSRQQPSIPQVPYYPESPSGPLAWPPTSHADRTGGSQSPDDLYPGESPLVTNPLGRVNLAAGGSGDNRPPTSLASSYRPYYAGFGVRLAAALIDIFFMSLFQVGTIVGLLWKSSTISTQDFSDWLGESWVFIALGIVLLFLYHFVQLAFWGQTIGKRLMSIKVVAADGALPGPGQVLLRMLGYLFSAAVAGWGFIMVALDPRRQGLHDRIAQTFVIPEKAPAVVPAGLAGYATQAGFATQNGSIRAGNLTSPATAVGMAAVSSRHPHSMLELAVTPDNLPVEYDATGDSDPSDAGRGRSSRSNETQLLTALDHENGSIPAANALRGPVTDMNMESSYQPSDFLSKSERARALFKQGLIEMERGAMRPSAGSLVDPSAARAAAYAFEEALLLVPNSVAYRYYYAVALRYSASFEVALREFAKVLELDPNHYEARQQTAYGQRWHDAFAYPSWVSPAPVEVGAPLPGALVSLLPPGHQPVTRLVLLREGGNKMAALLSRTPRAEWVTAVASDVPARLHLILSRTHYGPIIALYLVLQDRPQNPYVGETFLNPHDPDHPAGDACTLGQHMLEQLSRQDRTYLIFVDEENRVLMSRKLIFEAQTQVSIARVLYDAQMLPPQAIGPERFREAAQWHMEHFSLDDIKSAGN